MERRLAAILAVDMVGYSRLMAADEAGTIVRHKRHRETVIDPQIRHFNGRIVKTTGDGLLVEFPSVVDAVNCAVTFQSELDNVESNGPDESCVRYRAGINLGDIVIDGDDILGDGVNVAARLEAIAPPSGLCVSDMVRQNLRGTLGDTFEDLGEQALKNIDRGIRVWRWTAAGPQTTGAARPAPPRSENPSTSTIEILPFEVLSPKADQEFHAVGFAEDIATAISKLGTFRVLSTAPARGGAETTYQVKGSVRIAEPRVRCNVQLLETASGYRLWSEKFDGRVDQIFDFQDQVTELVVAALEIELTEGEQARTWRREAGDREAYDAFLQGRTAYKEYSRPGNARARTAYEAALKCNPMFLSAVVGLSRTHIEDATFDWSPDRKQSLDEARRVLEGVFAVDPDHASAHMELSHLLMVEGEFATARLEGELAVALDPNNADAHQALAHVLVCLGLPEEALRSSRRALSLNPGRPEFYLIPMAEAYVALERWQEALAVSEQIVAKRSSWVMGRILNILALQGLEKDSEAELAVRALLERSPGYSAARWKRAIFYPERRDVPELLDRLVSAGLPA